MTKIEKFMRSGLSEVDVYAASKASDVLSKEIGIPVDKIIKMDDNENPYGCSPRVMKAFATSHEFNTYADVTQKELHEQIAKYAGVEANWVTAENGSNMLIDDLLSIFIEPGDKVINFPPTFDIFRVRTNFRGGQLTVIPRDKSFAVDVKAARAAIDSKTKLIVLVSPNNPTGTITPKKDIQELIDTGLPMIVDEAYFEFCGETSAALVKQHENLMVLRTFSKWAGLAGIRLGYSITSPKIAEALMKVKIPFSVSIPARIAARESLADVDYLMSTVKKIVAERERLFNELGALKFIKPFPSKSNFIFCAVTKGSASEVQKKLEKKGILVRYFNLPYLENSLRIGVGKPEHTDALMKELRNIEGEISKA